MSALEIVGLSEGGTDEIPGSLISSIHSHWRSDRIRHAQGSTGKNQSGMLSLDPKVVSLSRLDGFVLVVAISQPPKIARRAALWACWGMLGMESGKHKHSVCANNSYQKPYK